jgi:hypothetical protein
MSRRLVLKLLVCVFALTVAARQTTARAIPVALQAPVTNQTPAPVPEAVAACLGCHEDTAMEMTFEDGSTMSLFVDVKHFEGSVHVSQLTCTDCHGAHDVANPHAKRAMVARSCAACHGDVYAEYARSVHGRAREEEDNQDVPACSDCHTHHQIQQPGTTRFRLGSPETCIRCHGDETLMATYGISTNVAQTYLADFHGVTASLSRNLSDDKQQIVVTCNVCHGVHNIASPRLLGPGVMKATVSQACNTCHQDAAPTFPVAWLSHYPPSPRNAPMVWAVESFYRFFIPFAIIGLILNISLHVLQDVGRPIGEDTGYEC